MIGLTGKPTGKFRKTDADSDAGTNFSQGLFFCHKGRKARRRSSFSYFACFSPASPFFFLAGGTDMPSKYRHMLFSRSAVKPRFRVWMLQYIREITAVDNMKIEPAMRLMKIPHYQPWRPKLWFDRERKLRICLCFLKVPVGWGINRRQVLICKLRTQILLVQRTSIQVILVFRTMFWLSRTTRQLRIWIPEVCTVFPIKLNIKEQCYGNFAVLGQFCAKIITLRLKSNKMLL